MKIVNNLNYQFVTFLGGSMLLKRLFLIILLVCAVVSFSSAQTTGKITGRVLDKESKEPLVGVNIMLEGTAIGASTDIDGKYLILNVPAGTYNLLVRLLGYREVTVKTLKVMVGFTTEQNVEMGSEAVELKEVVISAERPIIPKDQTGSVRVVTSEQIQLMPVRGFREMAATSAGIVQGERGGELNIRGGRSEETGYIVDGVWTNDPLTGSSSASVSQRAIQELIVMTGGYTAEYGNVMSGIVNVTTRSGKQNYFGSVEYVTDTFLGDGFNGMRNNGHQLISATLGGPIIPTNRNLLQFFGSFEYLFDRDPSPSYASEKLRNIANSVWPTFKRVSVNNLQYIKGLPALEGDELDQRAKELLLDEPTWNKVRPGQMPSGSRRRLSWNEKITVNLGDFRLNLSGISSRTESYGRVASYLLMNSFNNPVTDQQNDQYTFRITWAPEPKTYVDAQASYMFVESRTMSPTHRDRVFDYGDPYKNPLFGNYSSRPLDELYGGRIPFDDYFGRSGFAYPGRVYNLFSKQKTTFIQFNTNVTHQIGYHEIKLGGEYKIHQLRQYAVGPLFLALLRPGLKDTIQTNPDLLTDAQKKTVYQHYVANGVNTYGYDYFGREFDSDKYDKSKRAEGPKEPIFGSLFLQDKIEFDDFVVNAGLRWDYWNSNTYDIKDILDITNSKNTKLYGSPEKFKEKYQNQAVPTDGWGSSTSIDDDSFAKTKPYNILSPRLGFSFPVSDRTVFFAQYGTFSQLPPLAQSYNSQDYTRQLLNLGDISLNNPRLHPEKTTQYETGIRQQIGELASLNVAAYYKEITGLIQMGFVQSDFNPKSYVILQNGDYSTVRGMDLTFDLRRWNNFAASVNYTLSYATGTGSNPYTLSTIIWLNARAPKYETPLDYDQRHTISASLDYRLGKSDNFLLDQLGLNLLIRANSGRPYTPTDPNMSATASSSKPLATINSSTSGWNNRMDFRLDKTFDLTVSSLRLNAYILVLNLLNSKNIASVWGTSGKADETGYLYSDLGQISLQSLIDQGRVDEVPVFTGFYNMIESNPFRVGPPRQIRFGLSIEF